MINFKIWLEEQQYKYAVVLFPIPTKVSYEINSFSQKFIPKSSLVESEGGRENHSHITVLYGLNNNDYSEVEEKTKSFKAFNIKLGKVTKFDNKPEYDVIKIDVISEELKKLNKKLKEIPHYSSYNEFKPHCTLAYVKKNSCNDLIGKSYFEKTEIKIDYVYFKTTEKEKRKITLK